MDAGKLKSNPWAGLKIDTSDSIQRLPWRLEDLTKLAAANNLRTDASRWLFPLLLHTGARIGEMAQLELADIREVDGVPAIEIHDRQAEGHEKRSVKTKAGLRVVPVHADLIALGFLAHVEERRQAGDRFLFPRFIQKGKRIPSDIAGQEFTKLREEAGIGRDERFTAHSLRHNVRSALRSACRACEAARDKDRRPATPKPPPMTLVQRKERDRARHAAVATLRPPRPEKKPPRMKVGRYGPEPGVLMLDGVARTRNEWVEHLGLAGPSSLTNRAESLDWPIERTLTQHVIFQNRKSIQRQPLPSKHDVLFYDGRMQSIVEWTAELADPLRMTVPALCLRLRNGWPVELALSTIVRPHRRRKPKKQPPEFCGPKRPVGRPRSK